MLPKSCLRCRNGFEVGRKRAALCEECRDAKHRWQKRELQRELREDEQVILNNALPLIPVEHHEYARALVKGIVRQRDNTAKVSGWDRMPDGSKSAAGADEGRSSYFVDLRNELDALSAAAANDPWWDDNPAEDVFFELGHDDFYREFIGNAA